MIGDLTITALAAGNITMVILLLIQRRRHRHSSKISKPYRQHTTELKRQNELLLDALNHYSVEEG